MVSLILKRSRIHVTPKDTLNPKRTSSPQNYISVISVGSNAVHVKAMNCWCCYSSCLIVVICCVPAPVRSRACWASMNELDSLRQEAETLKNAIRVSTYVKMLVGSSPCPQYSQCLRPRPKGNWFCNRGVIAHTDLKVWRPQHGKQSSYAVVLEWHVWFGPVESVWYSVVLCGYEIGFQNGTCSLGMQLVDCGHENILGTLYSKTEFIIILKLSDIGI
jgi:hypothetical protein